MQLQFSFFKFLFLLAILFCPLLFLGQDIQPIQIEFEIKENTYNYNIIPLQNKSLLLFYSISNPDANKTIKLVKYDSILKENWNKEIKIKKNLSYSRYFYNKENNTFYLLFLRVKRSRIDINKDSEYNILALNLDNSDTKLSSGKFPERMLLSEFKVFNDKAIISGTSYPNSATIYSHAFMSLTFIPALTGLSFYKFKPVIINHDLINNKPDLLKIHQSSNSYYLNSNFTDNNNITFLHKEIKNHKKSYINFSYFNTQTKNISSEQHRISSDTTIVSAKLINFDNETYLTGTYKVEKRHYLRFNPFNKSFTELLLSSEGIFFNNISKNIVKYYPFNKMKNYKQHLFQVRKKFLLKKPENYSSQFILHDVVKRDDEFILICEAYHPEYHQEYYWTSDAYGRFFQDVREVFDGYRYTNALISAFNSNADLLWDNNFEIGNILTFNLKEKVKVMFDKQDIILAYSNEGKLASKVISRDKVIQEKEEANISIYGNDIRKQPLLHSEMDYWYDNYFITFGYRSLNELPQYKTKKIFFLNKIAFQ